MLGVAIQIAFSWLLLRIAEKKGLSVLGLIPTSQRLKQFSLGFLLAVFCCALYYLVLAKLVHAGWILNPQVTWKMAWASIGWNIKSVLFEEFLFRGVLLYLLISRVEGSWGVVISATCFGIYHWFSFGAFGNPASMLVTFIITAVMGLALAFSFAKTKSMFLPTGLHLGWNITNISVFSSGPLGPQVFIADPSAQTLALGILPSILMFLWQSFALPILTYWYLQVFERGEIDNKHTTDFERDPPHSCKPISES